MLRLMLLWVSLGFQCVVLPQQSHQRDKAVFIVLGCILRKVLCKTADLDIIVARLNFNDKSESLTSIHCLLCCPRLNLERGPTVDLDIAFMYFHIKLNIQLHIARPRLYLGCFGRGNGRLWLRLVRSSQVSCRVFRSFDSRSRPL